MPTIKRKRQKDEDEYGFLYPKESKLQEVQRILKSDIFEHYRKLKDANLPMHWITSYAKKSLAKASLADCVPTAKILITKLESDVPHQENTIRDVIKFIENGIRYKFASIMEKDLAPMAKLRRFVDNAISGWEWHTELILEGIAAANPSELEKIGDILTRREKEHRMLQRKIEHEITAVLEATREDFNRLAAEGAPCQEDKESLVNRLHSFDWSSEKLDRPYITSVLESLIQLELNKVIRGYDFERDRIGEFQDYDISPSKIKELNEDPDYLSDYLGSYPELTTLNQDIMEISCIAALIRRDSDGEENDSIDLSDDSEEDTHRMRIKRMLREEEAAAKTSSHVLEVNKLDGLKQKKEKPRSAKKQSAKKQKKQTIEDS